MINWNGISLLKMEVDMIIDSDASLTGHTPLIFQPHLPHTTLNSLQPLRSLSHSRIVFRKALSPYQRCCL